MMDGPSPQGFEPEHWIFAFSPRAARPWVRHLVWGKYKHVLALGFVPRSGCWVMVNPCFDRTAVEVIPDGEDIEALLLELFDQGCELVTVPVQFKGILPRFGLWCTSMCAHLAGFPVGALRPDAFLKQCLANGGSSLTIGDLTGGKDSHGSDKN